LKKVIASSLILGPLLVSNNIKATDLSQVYKNFKGGEYENVISLLNQSKNKDKKFLATKYYLQGISYARLQDFDQAITNFTKAIRNGSTASDIYYELGQALYAQNELEQSRKSFFRSAKNGYQASQSNYYIGHISQLLDEHKNAKKYFSKILKDKSTSENLMQVARFQMAESLLHLARKKDDIPKYVKKYILPQMNKAYKLNEKSATGKDIYKRIKEIEREFGLDPNLLINGKRIPSKRISASFTQSFSYDNNFTLSNDLPGNQQSQRDTYIFDTTLRASYKHVLKRRYIITPSLKIENVVHGDRESDTVYSADEYTISPAVDIRFAHKLFQKPAEFILDIEHEYKAKDREAKKDRILNNRTNRVTIGEKFKYFKFGDSTVKFGKDYFRAYDEVLDYDKSSFSYDQLIIWKDKIFVALIQRDITSYVTSIENDTASNLLRVDYIHPNLFPKTSFNFGLSNTWLSYDDVTKATERGTETTLTSTFKLTRNLNNYVSADLDYTYTKNSSELESSNYTKHVTKIEISLSY
jgi:tetratricopeptide (TPR) repeat protein